MAQKPKSLKDMIEAIRDNTEWLETTEQDTVECISIENLEGVLSKYFNRPIKISEDVEEEPPSRFTQLEMFKDELG